MEANHERRILVPNLDRYPCLWHLDCRWHSRRWRAFGLGANGTAYRYCGFDQPLSSNSRSQNRVAEPGPRASPRVKRLGGNGRRDPNMAICLEPMSQRELGYARPDANAPI